MCLTTILLALVLCGRGESRLLSSTVKKEARRGKDNNPTRHLDKQPRTSSSRCPMARISSRHRERDRSRFRYTWVWWYHSATSNRWDLGSYEKLEEARSRQDIINTFHRINFTKGDGFWFLMRKGIAPCWEDRSNCRGGRWRLRSINTANLAEGWKDIVFTCTNGTLLKNESLCASEITGVSLAMKKKSPTISIWNRHSWRNDYSLMRRIPRLGSIRIEYRKHYVAESLADEDPNKLRDEDWETLLKEMLRRGQNCSLMQERFSRLQHPKRLHYVVLIKSYLRMPMVASWKFPLRNMSLVDFEGAERVLMRLHEQNLKPSLCMYMDILLAYVNANRLENAVDVLNRMDQWKLQASSETYNIILRRLLMRQKIDVGKDLHSLMLEKGIGIENSTSQILLKTFGSLDGFNGKSYQMLRNESEPTLASLYVLAGLCLKNKTRESSACMENG